MYLVSDYRLLLLSSYLRYSANNRPRAETWLVGGPVPIPREFKIMSWPDNIQQNKLFPS